MLKNLGSERGQALILIALGFVGLLGFTALAIDGGRIYADRRYAQNRADAASLAGAGAAAGYLKEVQDDPTKDSEGTTGSDWDCEKPAVKAARLAAELQAVVNLGQNNINDPSTYVVEVYCPPKDSPTTKAIEVRVTVTFDSQTSFMHLVYGGVARNTVDAITWVIPRAPVAAGFAIATLDKNCSGGDKGIWFAGTGGEGEELDVIIEDGGIFSNSCINTSGPGTTKVLINNGAGPATYYETFSYSGGDTINPTPQPVDYRIDPIIPPPSCVGAVENPPSQDVGGVTVYQPGRYTSFSSINSDTLFEPGLYCFYDGAGISVSGGGGGITITGDGVTFYFKSGAGSFSTEGSATVNLSAPIEPCDTDEPGYITVDCFPAVPNLLIYFDKGNTNTIKIGGNSGSSYTGTVYARENLVMIGGTSENLSVSVQVIANSVKIHGNATIRMNYDESLIYHTPNMINLEK